MPFDTILVIDAETRWSSKEDSIISKYTLSSMTTEEYIRDPRFKAFGFCIHEYGASTPTQWYRHEELPNIFAMYDWSRTAVVCQKSMFDCGILSFIYDVHPVFIFDTLSMARAVRGVEAGNSLAKLADYYGLPPKGRAVHSTDGLQELTPEIEQELLEYCKHDVFLCEEIFKRLLVGYPVKELRLISMTIKMFTEPRLVLDAEMLQEAAIDEAAKLQNALERAGADESILASNLHFAEILKGYGITPPMKVSKQTGKPALALAKSDAHFQQLLNGDNEEVALLCEARIAVKSTQARTRAKRFIEIASRGALPVPLNYYAAETGRWGGTQQVNLQNMKRGGFLRKSIMAPNGYKIVVGDLSQIEPRVLAWFSDYDDLLHVFNSGGDPYATYGSQMFNKPGMTKESDPLLRQSAKSALLGAGYGLGWSAFAAQLLVGFLGAPPLRYTKTDAQQLGVTSVHAERFLNYPDNLRRMAEIAHTCTDKELFIHCLAAKAIIDKYRDTAAPVVDFWNLLGKLTQSALLGGVEYNHKDALLFRKEEIVLSSGMSLKYPNLRQEDELDYNGKKTGKMQYVYDLGNQKHKLYPGRICNHVCQSTARIIMTDGMLRIEKRYPVLFTVHDEGGYLVPNAEAKEAEKWVYEQMIVEPAWMPGIPLDADVGVGGRYGNIK